MAAPGFWRWNEPNTPSDPTLIMYVWSRWGLPGLIRLFNSGLVVEVGMIDEDSGRPPECSMIFGWEVHDAVGQTVATGGNLGTGSSRALALPGGCYLVLYYPC